MGKTPSTYGNEQNDRNLWYSSQGPIKLRFTKSFFTIGVKWEYLQGHINWLCLCSEKSMVTRCRTHL